MFKYLLPTMTYCWAIVNANYSSRHHGLSTIDIWWDVLEVDVSDGCVLWTVDLAEHPAFIMLEVSKYLKSVHRSICFLVLLHRSVTYFHHFILSVVSAIIFTWIQSREAIISSIALWWPLYFTTNCMIAIREDR